MRRLAAFGSFALAVAGPVLAQVPGEGGTDHVRYYGDRIALIQSVGIKYNEAVELAAQGSGFLLDDRFVITSDHVVPDVAHRYRDFTLNVRLSQRTSEPLAATVVARDPANDLALLELASPRAPSPYCPVTALMPPAQLPEGSLLYILGFPLDRPRTVAFGLLGSNLPGQRIQSSILLVPSYSGSPIFSSKGYLVAIAQQGVVSTTRPDGTTVDVDGISDLIPISTLANSPVGQYLLQNTSSQCWRQSTSLPTLGEFAWLAPGSGLPAIAAAGVPATTASEGDGGWSSVLSAVGAPVPSVGAPPPPPDAIRIEHALSEVKDDHAATATTKVYNRSFKAEPGYLVDSCDLEVVSANRESGVRCVVAMDRRSVAVMFQLSSGPFFDQRRGWLITSVALSQKRADLLENIPLVDQKQVRYPVSYRQDDHSLAVTTKAYTHPVQAEPGYAIKDCSFESLSTNNAQNVKCAIAPNGKSAALTFSLKSGPLYDQWRGWLDGALVTRLERVP